MKPICKIDKCGNKEWCLNSYLHREDGPTYEGVGGTKVWYINGNLHREDGPAIEYANGDKYWYYHGKKIDCTTQEQFVKIINMIAFW